MSTRQYLLDRMRAAKPAILAKYPIRSLAIFGSVSRSEDGPESDVDVLVEFSQPVGMQFIRLAEELQALLGRKVDLVSRGGIKPGYYEAIRKDMIDV
ncbi:MAG: nucleotidyltransferase family protein [Flavobacteriales bacterium]|nr:nucleotidyltransferase family protein [Flavobacteriales bacterium]MBP9079052.1 nucleotidyltransferase family protein [Flavobacteriales bacterium]